MVEILLYVANAVVDLGNILLCYHKIYGAPIKKNRLWFLGTFVGIVMLNFVNCCIHNPINATILNMIFSLIAVLFLFEGKKLKWFLFYPSACIVASIVNVAASYVIALILSMTQVQVAEDMRLALLANCIFGVIMLLIILLQKKGFMPEYQKILSNGSLQGAITIGAYAIYFLVGMLMLAGERATMTRNVANILGLSSSVIGIVFFVVCFRLAYVLNQNTIIQNEKNMIDVQLEAQGNYIELIQKKDEDMRKFRHDVSEHINVIGYCIENGRYDEAAEYLEKTKLGFEHARLKKYTGIASIDAVLSDKEESMRDKGIKFSIQQSFIGLPNAIDAFDVCTVIINVLTNAIRACEELPEEEKEILFVLDSDGKQLYLSEKNACHKKIKFSQDHCPISDKTEKNHGLGSKNIQAVVKKYDGDICYLIKDDQFCIEVVL